MWKHYLTGGHSDEYMNTFAKCIEDAVISFTDKEGTDAKLHRGRSHVNIRTTRKVMHKQHQVHDGVTEHIFASPDH